MADLQVTVGAAARNAWCSAFDAAQSSISAEFYRVTDPAVIASLNAAAERGVQVHVEVEGLPDRYHRATDARADATPASGSADQTRARFSPLVHVDVSADPAVLLHAKAALIDDRQALIATANQTPSGFYSPGEVVVSDTNPLDVAALAAVLGRKDPEQSACFVSGPGTQLRARIGALFASTADLSIAVEDISDPAIVRSLEERRSAGHSDRLLINACKKVSPTEARSIRELEAAGVAVRALPRQYMHEKYIDAGAEIYVGSANLTHNGLDEAREAALVASPQCFDDGAASLRADFEGNWKRATAVRLRGCVPQVLEKAA